MKYKELFEALKGMREDQLDAEVMVFKNGEGMNCHLVGDDIRINIAPMGAIMNGSQVMDDYYGIADDEDEMTNVKKLLDSHQPYLMIGVGSIPTCKEGR